MLGLARACGGESAYGAGGCAGRSREGCPVCEYFGLIAGGPEGQGGFHRRGDREWVPVGGVVGCGFVRRVGDARGLLAPVRSFSTWSAYVCIGMVFPLRALVSRCILGESRMMSVSRALLKASLISGVLRRLEWKVSRDGAWRAGLRGRVRVSLDSGRVRVRIRGLWSERKSESAVFVGRIVQRETL